MLKTLKDGLLVLLLIVVVPSLMTACEQYRERQQLESELNARKAVACPPTLQGHALLGNHVSAHDVFRTRNVVLSCVYAKGVEG